MRPLKSLTFKRVVEILSAKFGGMEDSRAEGRLKFTLRDTMMAGFAVFFFQYPSLLKFQAKMKKERGRNNLGTMFGIRELVSDSQMREILDGCATEPVRELLPELFEHARRAGWSAEFKTIVDQKGRLESYYVMPLDGTEYFNSSRIACKRCLTRRTPDGETNYYHSVVAATLVKPGSHRVWPIAAELVRSLDGEKKQDCELKAAKRLIERFRSDHPHLDVIVTGDDLYSHGPYIELLREKRLKFVLVAKDSSHCEMGEWIEGIEKAGGVLRGKYETGPAAKRRYFEYRIVEDVPLNYKGEIKVNYFEVWERDKKGKLLYHNSWVTDFEVDERNIAEMIGIGRSRWKIENEQFNVQKNHGYELTHNFGHGKETLSEIFYLLNLIAFLVHKILEIGDRHYQRCMANETKRDLWTALRVAANWFLFESWDAMLLFLLEKQEQSP
jgi:hypothetical protein